MRESRWILFNLPPSPHPWRGLRLLLGLYGGSLILSAILSPPVYWAIQTWAETFPNRLATYLAGKDFPDYFDRLRWLPVVLLLPWLMRQCGLWSLPRLGLGGPWRQALAHFLGWASVGVALLSLAALVQQAFLAVAMDARYVFGGAAGVGLRMLPGALAIGLLEEIVFRGLVFRILATAVRPAWAIGLSALFYAYTHFKMPSEVWEAVPRTVGWDSGWFVAGWTVLGITVNFAWLPFLTLLALGVVLALLYGRGGSLWAPAGLHAGLVWALLGYQRVFNVVEPGHSLWFGSERLTDGLLPLGLLLLLALRLVSQRPPPPAAGSGAA